jgi:hypothetical protein
MKKGVQEFEEFKEFKEPVFGRWGRRTRIKGIIFLWSLIWALCKAHLELLNF